MIYIMGRWLGKLSLEGFWEGHEDTYNVSCQSAFADNQLAHLPSSWLVNQATSQFLVIQGINTWLKLTIMCHASWGLSRWENHVYVIKEAFLVKEWYSFHCSRKELDYLHLKDFLKYECKLYLEQPLTSPQCKFIIAYRTLNHRLGIEIGRWLTIPISRDDKLCHFCSYNLGGCTVYYVWEPRAFMTPLKNPLVYERLYV